MDCLVLSLVFFPATRNQQSENKI